MHRNQRFGDFVLSVQASYYFVTTPNQVEQLSLKVDHGCSPDYRDMHGIFYVAGLYFK